MVSTHSLRGNMPGLSLPAALRYSQAKSGIQTVARKHSEPLSLEEMADVTNGLYS